MSKAGMRFTGVLFLLMFPLVALFWAISGKIQYKESWAMIYRDIKRDFWHLIGMVFG